MTTKSCSLYYCQVFIQEDGSIRFVKDGSNLADIYHNDYLEIDKHNAYNLVDELEGFKKMAIKFGYPEKAKMTKGCQQCIFSNILGLDYFDNSEEKKDYSKINQLLMSSNHPQKGVRVTMRKYSCPEHTTLMPTAYAIIKLNMFEDGKKLKDFLDSVYKQQSTEKLKL